MYDAGGHRICRCLKTGAIIDSSSHDGAVVKLPGDEWKYNGSTFVWDAEGDGIVTESDGFQEPFHWFSFEKGLACCFLQFARSPEVLTQFRFTKTNGQRRKGGYVKWVIAEKQQPNGDPPKAYLMLKKWKKDPSPQRIVWREGKANYRDRKGTPNTSIQCWFAVEDFVEKVGSMTLWGMDDCDFVHGQIWVNLVQHYGFPVLKHSYSPDS
ncbi:hypothetical protein FAGAP_4217 [Fusarium agapanthi]|uniref:Uncharacterized protein n=1 Tax=Fusarium agapanthi TaxID=1803897 RepID=A0A9P5BBX6_9HYPO|nr:hypothetical protein FAGAP_4217 [Fusarium agapanthi]